MLVRRLSPNFTMLPTSFILSLFPILSIAQSTPAILCVPGQCLQGYSNTTIGAALTNSGLPIPIRLLPGTYATTTNPQLLHDSLTSTSAGLSASAGFTNSTSISLPLNLALQPGLSVYSGTLYSGLSRFQILPAVPVVNTSIVLSFKSFASSSNVWMALNTGSSSNNRIIVWDSIPDTSQLPAANQGQLALTDIQSAACTPACSASGGVCTATGSCQCLTGFTGAACESCTSGFFGPSCQQCPTNCRQCDDGINGSGRCLRPEIANDPASCNCQNGVCGTNGQCTCNPGFTTGPNGQACSRCAPGFFQTSNGDCQVCQIGCTSCADGTGACQTCKSGFSRDANDATKCTPPAQSTASGVVCPSGSFANGGACSQCSSSCQTCTGSTSNDCIVCASGSFTLNGACVSADANGICQGSTLIADNNKRECDTCGAKCTKCQIPNFTVASTANQKQCTECLPGFFLSRGACVAACPTGTTLSAQDGRTCIACDSSCRTCFGTSIFCLTCNSTQLASNGRCVSSCPSGTFSSSGACIPCHPDCASCSGGGAFNQCTSCPPSRPVLSNGRCLPTCAKNQFFDRTNGACQKCDDTCSSCSGAGPSNCLACSSSSQVLRSGTCVAANCGSVVSGLGVCLSELVVSKTTDPAAPPLPSVTGLNSPTVIEQKPRLEWWQILLMVLGCLFILISVLWCLRRRQKKKRTQKTEIYAVGANRTRDQTSLRWRLMNSLDWVFRCRRTRTRRVRIKPGDIVHLGPSEEAEFGRLRDVEEAGMYEYTPARSTPVTVTLDRIRPVRPPSPERSGVHHPYYSRVAATERIDHDARSSFSDGSSHSSAPSIYSQMTGVPRHAADPRMPVKSDEANLLKFSEPLVVSDGRGMGKYPLSKF